MKGAFTGVSAGAGVAAALGVYASTFGALGGYAVAAQGVGLLSTLGLSFSATSGTAGIMTGISAIGGPVVLTAILAVGIALGIKRLFGDSWQRRLAKQITKTVEEKQVYQSITKNIDSEFQQIHDAVENGCTNLKEQYLIHVELMENELKNPAKTKEKLIKHIDFLRRDLSFFVEAPWAQV